MKKENKKKEIKKTDNNTRSFQGIASRFFMT